MYRAFANAALWVVPAAGHGPIFLAAADAFVQDAIAFLEAGEPAPFLQQRPLESNTIE